MCLLLMQMVFSVEEIEVIKLFPGPLSRLAINNYSHFEAFFVLVVKFSDNK